MPALMLAILAAACLAAEGGDASRPATPRSLCTHQRQKHLCRDCGGSSICEHDRRRSRCRECGRSSIICEHDRERSKCRECDGSSICEHKRMRSRCRECGGSSICEHDRQRSSCRECAKHPCSVLLDQAGVGFVHDKAMLERDAACPGARCRPDFQVKHDAQGLVDIWVEVDEHQHRERVCELNRLNEMLISRKWQMRPLVVVRLNVDAFETGFKPSSEPFPKQERHAILLRELKHHTDDARLLAGISPAGGDLVPSAAPHAGNPEEACSSARDAVGTSPEVYKVHLSDKAEGALLKVVRICFDCECTDQTLCNFVHSKSYQDQESIARDMETEGT